MPCRIEQWDLNYEHLHYRNCVIHYTICIQEVYCTQKLSHHIAINFISYSYVSVHWLHTRISSQLFMLASTFLIENCNFIIYNQLSVQTLITPHNQLGGTLLVATAPKTEVSLFFEKKDDSVYSLTVSICFSAVSVPALK